MRYSVKVLAVSRYTCNTMRYSMKVLAVSRYTCNTMGYSVKVLAVSRYTCTTMRYSVKVWAVSRYTCNTMRYSVKVWAVSVLYSFKFSPFDHTRIFANFKLCYQCFISLLFCVVSRTNVPYTYVECLYYQVHRVFCLRCCLGELISWQTFTLLINFQSVELILTRHTSIYI